MKTRIILSILALGLFSSLNAYELDGDIGIKWTGYKLASKVGVSGTFNKVDLDINKSENLSDFLKSAKVKIDATTLESKDAGRNANIVSTLFSLSSANFIEGKVVEVNEANKTILLDIKMNEVVKSTSMKYEIKDNKIIASGVVDILDFNMKNSYLAFTQKCATLHENKSYSDVGIEFTIPFK